MPMAPPPARPAAEPQRIGLVLLPGFSLAALAGVVEVLQAANELLDTAAYEPVPLSPLGHGVAAGSGVLVAARPLGDAPALLAALVISDGPVPGARHLPDTAPLLAWLVAQAAAGRVLGGVGSGAAWLAEAGLLRGHRATVHWPQIAPLAQRHADMVVSRRRVEIDRQRLSAAGQQAGRDLLITWLAQRHGAALAPALAAQLGLARPPAADEDQQPPPAALFDGTAPAGLAGKAGGTGSAKLAEALALMQANLAEPLPTEEVARLVGVSRRQLERLFRQHLDALPSRWYLALRLQHARNLLRQTHQSVLQVGLGCGFASGPHFSNAYRAHFGRTPRDERSARVVAWQRGTSAAPVVDAPHTARATTK
ncbi:MAG TPA: helix-turn-helix domain-containing protein [Aquabacterium sp.]|nr:helix-turn-helix domain-containing protein [Aquabacterium sp.]